MSQILSQDEVNALLKGVADGSVTTEGASQQSPGVQPCDLTRQERSLLGRMPGLDRAFDAFARALRTSLEAVLGEISGLTVVSIELLRYGNWVRRLPLPVSVHVFRLAPLHGNGLLVLSPALAAVALEVSFGGKGHRQAIVEGREYSVIETRVLQRFVSRILADFQHAWRPIEQLELSVVRSESNPGHAPVTSENAVALIAELRISLEADDGLTFSVCIPYGALDPVRPKLAGNVDMSDGGRATSWDGQFRARIGDVQLGVKVELGTCSLNVGSVLVLKPGDVLTLEKRRDEPVVVHVEGRPKFYGVPGIAGDGHAVQILGRVNTVPTDLNTA
jgi:flagellar motor switch protein FliM